MEGFKKIVKMKTGGLVKTPVTGDKKATAPSKAVLKPAFKGSDESKDIIKPSGHKDPYIKSKDVPAALGVPSAAVKGRNKKSVGTISKFKCGGKIVKKADGGGILNAIGNVGTQLKNNVMGTPEQNRVAQAQMDRVKARKAAEQAALLGGAGGAQALQQGATVPSVGQVGSPITDGSAPMKKGGKVKGKC